MNVHETLVVYIFSSTSLSSHNHMHIILQFTVFRIVEALCFYESVKNWVNFVETQTLRVQWNWKCETELVREITDRGTKPTGL